MTAQRLKSVAEIILVMISLDLLITGWIVSGLREIELPLYWGYFSHVLYFVVPIAIILGAKRSLETYGLTLSGWRYNLKWGILLILIVILPIIVSVATGFILVENNLDLPYYVLSTLIFQFLFAGFGEEILFRGYYQSRLNEGFGRPFRILNLEFGWGVFITAILFGLVHVFFWPRLFIGNFEINIMSGIYTGMIGLTLGFAREKSESILAPSLMHGLWDCTVVFLVQAEVFTILSILGWALCTIAVFMVFARTEIGKMGETSRSQLEV